MQRVPSRLLVPLVAATFGATDVSIAADRPPQDAAVVAETEVSDVARLPPPGPHRLVIGGSLQAGGVRVVDGDKVGLAGTMHSVSGSNVVIDPNGKYYYLAETSFARGNRGPRQDYISIYDDQLKLAAEIDLPGRLISVPKTQTFDVSSDGRFGYVFNMQPAASVTVVDLIARKVATVVEVPGCGLVYSFGPRGFASLCSDGSAAVAVPAAKGSKYTVARTASFFDAEKDPVFEESPIDRQTGNALFITYTGKVIPVALGATPVFAESWSLQQAAGHPLPSTEPEFLAWRPGGSKLATLHKATGRLFVLMHPGAHWTHKQEGTEVWVFDIAARKRVARFALKQPMDSIAVTQDAEPLLFAVGGGPMGSLTVMDARTGETKGALPGVSGGILAVHGF